MTCCIQIDTPQSIYDEGNDYYPKETDIFEEIFTAAEGSFTYGTLMQAALWHAFRYRMISSCDTEEWVQVMADRLDLIGPKWDAIIDKLDNVDLADLKELHYQRVIQRTAIENTEGDVRTHHYEHENLPETLTTTTKYLDSRDDTTDKYAPNTQDTEDYDEERDLAAITFTKMMNAYPNIMLKFCDEFENYFMVML